MDCFLLSKIDVGNGKFPTDFLFKQVIMDCFLLSTTDVGNGKFSADFLFGQVIMDCLTTYV